LPFRNANIGSLHIRHIVGVSWGRIEAKNSQIAYSCNMAKQPVRRKPEQERSVKSMNRMIEAGEQLFYEGGSSALTLNAVLERAGTSTGSFYARFGDMRGFTNAMHEHVLELVSAELIKAYAKASKQPDLESAVQAICIESFKIVSKHRFSLYFFAVGNLQDPQGRAIGKEFRFSMSDMFIEIMKSYLPKNSSLARKQRLDFAARMGVSALYQQIMFDQKEMSLLTVKEKNSAIALADMICLYLRATK
jgi:AcrR family transcriptional regulator